MNIITYAKRLFSLPNMFLSKMAVAILNMSSKCILNLNKDLLLLEFNSIQFS